MLRKKINGFQQAKPLCKKLQNDQYNAIFSFRSDHGRNLKILVLNYSATNLGSVKKFCTPITL